MTIETDAEEFRLGEWRRALLVARNVERKGAGPKVSTMVWSDRKGRNKISPSAFALMSQTSYHRIYRYLDAWERAANAGIVPHAKELQPGDELSLDHLGNFKFGAPVENSQDSR